MQADQDLRQAGEVLHEADDALGQLDRDEHQGGAGGAPRAGGPGGEPYRRAQAEQQEHHVGVELGDDLRVEPGAVRVGVARVGARARHDHAEHDHGGRDGGQHLDELAQGTG
ncbi:hypothetical protein GCM10009687_26780 [Asanoa iriomotensis]|uniref:Uncharacterized protein n=1 Tax=Asanoa iriomotensis TaxID=234613 RepID=A0ABQ4C0P0_9ACTN|nr:hypothetical protein Air01nite_24420 [Asanoa iriomotensis]